VLRLLPVAGWAHPLKSNGNGNGHTNGNGHDALAHHNGNGNGDGNGNGEGHESHDAADGVHEDNGLNGQDHVDDLARLIDGLKIPPHVAAMSYPRGVRIRRLRVAAPKNAGATTEKRHPLTVSRRTLRAPAGDAPSGQ